MKTAYNKLVLKYHPDKVRKMKNESDDAYKLRSNYAQTQFEKIQTAYEYLTDQNNK